MATLRKFHLIWSLPVDLMHLLFKGILPLFFETISLTDDDKEQINRKTALLDIPSVFSRKPRSWKEINQMKANEMRDILFYSILVYSTYVLVLAA